MQSSWRRKANNALGAFVIALLFLVESTVAHRVAPSPLSPFIWAVLGIVAIASLAIYFRCRRKALQTGAAPAGKA